MASSNNQQDTSMKDRIRGRDVYSNRHITSSPKNPVACTAGYQGFKRPKNGRPIATAFPAAPAPSTASTMPNIRVALGTYLQPRQPPYSRPLGGHPLHVQPPPRTLSRRPWGSQDSGTSRFLDEEWERESWEKDRIKSIGKENDNPSGVWNPFGEGKKIGERLALEEFMEREKIRHKLERERALCLSVPQPMCTILTDLDPLQSSFSVHKNVITAASPYFRAAFDGNFKEGSTLTLNLDYVETATFGLLLQYVYTSKLTLESPTSAALLAKLWLLAEFFLMPELQNKAMDMLFDLLMQPDIAGDLLVVYQPVEELMDFLWETKAGEEAGDRATVLRNLVVLFWARRVSVPVLKENLLGLPAELQVEIAGMMRIFQGSFNRTLVDLFRVNWSVEKKNELRVG